MKYRINAQPIQGGRPLSFTVDEYIVEEGFVKFTDRKTGKKKIFAVANVEIEVLEDG